MNPKVSLSLLFSAFVLLMVLAGCGSPTAEPTAVPASPEVAATAVPPTIAADLSVVHICDDIGEWPPYSYYKRVNGEKTTEVTGYAVDVAQEILSQHDLSFTVELLPWKRCLDGVEAGQEYQMVFNASYNEERAQKYYISDQFYVMNSYYFYSKKQHPDGLSISGVADLKNYQVCGVLGYNYDEYDVPEIDTGATDYVSLIGKVQAGRCDLFIEKYEGIAGFSLIGKDFLGDPDLGYAPIADTKPTAFYMMFPKNEQGLELKTMIDTGLKELQASGRLAELFKKYVP